jgi:xanthine dehydrogenase accessory factor
MDLDIYQEIVELRRQGRCAALATIINRKGSTPRKDATKMLITADGRQFGTLGGGCTEADILREAMTVMRLERPKILAFDLTEDDAEDSGLICGGTMEVFVEPILPDPYLFIFGAGHVGKSISEAVTKVGFKVAVVDDRIKYANRERFPEVDSLHAEDWDEAFNKLSITESSYIVIATRGHNHDLACLRFALRSPARYIGLLGSKRKTRLFFEKLEKEGIDPSDFDRVYAPVGIDIGSESPEEIAVSIAAELIAVRKNKPVDSLKMSRASD